MKKSCGCKPGTHEGGWQEKRCSECVQVEQNAFVQAMQGLRFSNAAGLHQDKRTRRVRTRGAAKARAIRESE